ncbi:hypothetical protein FDP41_003451 [Naegleria fowleri]|uniref:Ubiquitin-like domain-containing protein n=1 Tax=Naegleria fowleri TaxID=5763 RepID=A0A6A5BX09_NAEFO|nr:uncharacterized protein FDP41_003451 [Naegleria fowleri]KAF0977459.1 hypothetical protein FDP41_003451 [Naegleria fowleri]CAG4711245.1 unnamed protein product [Naegleria fowleri]
MSESAATVRQPPLSLPNQRPVLFRWTTTHDNKTHNEKMTILLSDTVLIVKEKLKRQGIIDDVSQSKMIFSGKILENNQKFSQIFDLHCDQSVDVPTVHLFGGLAKNQKSSSNKNEETIEVVEPKTPTTPFTPSTPNSAATILLQKQLLLQQQMLMTQMMMNQLILANSPTLHSAPVVGTSSFNPFPSTPTPVTPLTASVFQQNMFPSQPTFQQQSAESRVAEAATTQPQERQPENIQQPENVQQPQGEQHQQPAAAAQEQPQRLIDDNAPAAAAQDEGYNLFYTFLKVLLISTVIFSKEGWVTWLSCTIGFYIGIILLKYLNNVINRRVQRDQERREREEQARREQERLEREGSEIPPTIELSQAAIPQNRGVFGTLFHIVYLFFISLAPSYQPRRPLVVHDEERHED